MRQGPEARKLVRVACGLVTAVMSFLVPGIGHTDTCDSFVHIQSWGTEGSGPGEFHLPSGIAIGPGGIIYVADWGNFRVQKLDADGQYLSEWFLPCRDVATDSQGNVYVVVSLQPGEVRKFDSSGALVGTWIVGPNPTTIATDDHDSIYLLSHDLTNLESSIDKYSPSGSLLQALGNPQALIGRGLAVEASGKVFVADQVGGVVRWFDPNASLYGSFGVLASPFDVAIAPDGALLVAERLGHAIHIFTGTGAPLCSFGSYGDGPGEFNNPISIAVDSQYGVYVLEHEGNRIQKFGFGLVQTTQTTWGRVKAERR